MGCWRVYRCKTDGISNLPCPRFLQHGFGILCLQETHTTDSTLGGTELVPSGSLTVTLLALASKQRSTVSFPIPEDNNVVYSTYADHVHLKDGKCVQGGRCFLRTCVDQIGSLSGPLLLHVIAGWFACLANGTVQPWVEGELFGGDAKRSQHAYHRHVTVTHGKSLMPIRFYFHERDAICRFPMFADGCPHTSASMDLLRSDSPDFGREVFLNTGAFLCSKNHRLLA